VFGFRAWGSVFSVVDHSGSYLKIHMPLKYNLIWGFGFKNVLGFGFRVLGFRIAVKDLGLTVQGLG